MRRVRDLNLGTRIALYTFLFGTVIGLCFTFLFSHYTRRGVLALAELALAEDADHTAHFVDELLASRIVLAQTMATVKSIESAATTSNAKVSHLAEEVRSARIAELDARWRDTAAVDDPFVAQYLENEVALELLAQVSAHPGIYGEIFLTNRFGMLIASTGKLTTLAHAHKYWWQAAYAEGRGATFVDDRGYDASVGDYVLGVVAPVMIDGEVAGVLKCNFSILAAIGEALQATSAHDGGVGGVFLARSNGLIVSGPGLRPLQTSVSEELIEAFAVRDRGWLATEAGGEEHLVAFAQIPSTSRGETSSFGGTEESSDHSSGNAEESWFVLVEADMGHVLASASGAIAQMASIALGAIATMAIASLFIGWGISKPAERLEAEVRAFGPENLSARAPVERSDEIGRLARSFNTMADHLESSVVSKDILVEEVARRELVEDVLRESEKKYRKLFENMVSGFALHEMIFDPKGRAVDYAFLDVNSAFERIVGVRRESLLGRRVTEVFPGIEHDPANWIERYGSVVSTGVDIGFEQYSDSLDQWFSVTAYTPREGQFATIFEDISDGKRMEAKLRQSQKLESLGTLASGVAHEINNPLMGMLNYAELVKDRTSDPESIEYLSEITSEGNRIATIVRNLLSFSRQEGTRFSPTSVREVVDKSLSLVGAIMRRDQIAVEIDIPDDLPLPECHDQQIQQVVVNLLTNAHDSLNGRYPGHDEDKKIRIIGRAFEKDGRVWVRTTVEDYGMGMSADVAERIFDPFFSTKPRNEGTGLGLSVSFGIVSEHGGELTLERSPGADINDRLSPDAPIYVIRSLRLPGQVVEFGSATNCKGTAELLRQKRTERR